MRIPILFLSFCLLVKTLPLPAHAEVTELLTNNPLPGVTFREEIRSQPPTRFFVAEVDLTDPHLHLHVAPGGPDPDGPGEWKTTLMQPTAVANREKFNFVINGDFFDALKVKDAEGTNSGYRSGQWAAPVGPAVSDGKVWSSNSKATPCLVVHTNGQVTIQMVTQPTADEWEVLAGNLILVKNGVVVHSPIKTRHPRTVVGLDASGKKLIVLLVDGRKPGIAVGMSYDELAAEMKRLGCWVALNLDGGGSSVMAVRDPASGKMKILNEPTDGRERAVADVLGISLDQP